MPELKIKDESPHCSKHVLPLVVGGLTITCEDNMELMKRYPDNYFDLAIVDPPYNVGASDGSFGNRGYDSKTSKLKHYANHDKTPTKDYFDELFRVSKNQIIWGSNYYPEYLNHSGAIIWHKKTDGPLSDCEIAYQSFNKLVKYYFSEWQGFLKGGEKSERVHPNQKPIRLYELLLKNYAKEGDKILDTHLGSGSIAIACHNYKYNLTACELHPEYFEKAKQRIINHVAQQSLF
jgi:site-specific DNA-methyltransferase (adenine-specific)